ncbi:MAG: hypothetical protein U0353_26625 [Sandaracinus sp.]
MSLFRSGTLLVPLCVAALAGCGETHTDVQDSGPIMFDLDGARFPDVPPEPDAALGVGNVGAACTTEADCTGAATVCLPDQPGFLPGGYCSAMCDTADPSSCPMGSTCLDTGRGQMFCFLSCESGASPRPCRAGYGCASGIGFGNVCVAGCTDETDCTGGQMCDPSGGDLGAGQCYTAGATIGGACAADGECPMGAVCNSEAGGGWPGGACIGGDCDPVAGTGCPADQACLPTAFGGGGVCADGGATDADCRTNFACRPVPGAPDRTYCAPACDSDTDCTVAGNVCNAATGTCAPPFVDGRLGQTCSGREPCVGGTCLREFDSGYPSGYCAYIGCDVGTSGSCPDDGVCATRGSRTLCLDACTASTDCRAGYACLPADPADPASATACVPACTDDMQCTSRFVDTICNLGTGLCLQMFDPAALGDACMSSAECVGGVCLGEASTGWPAGTCAFPGCRLSGEGASSPCPMGSTCVDDGAGDPAIGVCVTSCGAGTTCRAGYACLDGACRPACEAASCSGGRTCDMATGRCL